MECLEDSCYDSQKCAQRVLEQFHKESLEDLDLSGKDEIVSALGALLFYLQQTQRTGMERMNGISLYTGSQYMRLDLNARRNLELLETMRTKEKKGSLLWILDKTKTAMGKRLIRGWLTQPLLNPGQITRRQNAVEELFGEDVYKRQGP